MTQSATARDVANSAESLVASLPQTIMSLLLQISLQPEDSVHLDGHLAKVERAATHIGAEFEMAFEAVAEPLSDDLSEAVQSLKAALRDIHDRVEREMADPDAGSTLALTRMVETKLAPAIAGFLGALFTQVVEFERASTKLAQDVDSGALAQIDSLSRQIGFIAVNAAVEAARVGDAGRGFSVIAAEIKALSDKSRIAVEQMRRAVA